MRTHQSSTGLAFTERATGAESVAFHDGMVVAAEDLETASRYPVALLRSVLRAYLGCGVVCGLELSAPQKLPGAPVWVVRIDRGLALDCHGFPIELVCPVELDLTPDPCAREDQPRRINVNIAIRRITSDEVRSQPCGCAQQQSDDDCSRVRERALVKAFTDAQLDELPGGVCGHRLDRGSGCSDPVAGHGEPGGGVSTENADEEENTETEEVVDVTDWCAALKQCDCSCDGDWVLLGTVDLVHEDDPKQGRKKGVGGIDLKDRRWVKPTEATCALENRQGQVTTFADRVESLEQQVKDLVEKVGALQNPSVPG